ncbi:MAG: hypothetical protein AAFU41_13280 [Pseudomonadota bacterium]
MPIVTEEEACAIYQDLLDRICDAYFSDDFASFQTAIHVPHQYKTEDGEHRIETYEQMHEAFKAFRDYLIGVGVTNFVRRCTGALALSEAKLIGSHETDLLQNGVRLREPYEVWATLELVEGQWKVVSSENAVKDTCWQSFAFQHGARSAAGRQEHKR